MFVTTHRGDQHLTLGLLVMFTRYEQAAGMARLKRIVVDREGMSAEFLAALTNEGRTVVTILRTDQYAGLESFRQVGEFVPLQVDQQSKVIREVALACFGLHLPEHPGQELEVRVALFRDWRRLVPNASSSEEVGRLYGSMVQFHPELYRRSGSGKRGIHGPATVFKYPSIPA